MKLSTFLWMVFPFSVPIGKDEMVKTGSETQREWLVCYTPVMIKALQWGCSCPNLINLYLCPAQLLFTAIWYQETMAWSLVWFSVVSHFIPSNNGSIWKGVYFPAGRLCAVCPVSTAHVSSPQLGQSTTAVLHPRHHRCATPPPPPLCSDLNIVLSPSTRIRPLTRKKCAHL